MPLSKREVVPCVGSTRRYGIKASAQFDAVLESLIGRRPEPCDPHSQHNCPSSVETDSDMLELRANRAFADSCLSPASTWQGPQDYPSAGTKDRRVVVVVAYTLVAAVDDELD